MHSAHWCQLCEASFVRGDAMVAAYDGVEMMMADNDVDDDGRVGAAAAAIVATAAAVAMLMCTV